VRRLKFFRKLEEVLADPEVDLVDLCTPTPLHPEQAIAALQSGKHVVCEKPLARTSAGAREIIKAQERAPGFSDAGDVHALLAGMELAETSSPGKDFRQSFSGPFPPDVRNACLEQTRDIHGRQ